MHCTIEWHTIGRVIHVKVSGEPTQSELIAINDSVTKILDNSSAPLILVIDATRMKTSYFTTDHLRNTQAYVNHHKLKAIYAIAENKLNRLILLMAFSLCGARFMQFSSTETLERVLQIQA